MRTNEIRVQGYLDQHWSAWFNDLAISYDADGNPVLCGPLVQDAALYGVLNTARERCAIWFYACSPYAECRLMLHSTGDLKRLSNTESGL